MSFDTNVYEVLRPIGEQADKGRPSIAPRMPDLRGKTIGQVSNGIFRADEVFSTIGELMKNRFPDVKIIPWTEFPIVSPMGDMDKICGDIREALLEKGCDAVISSTGA